MSNTNRLAALLSILFVTAFACGQDDEKNELGVWGGYSPDSTTSIRFLGRVPDTKLGIVGVRYSRRFFTGDNVALRYTAEVVPIAVLSYPRLIGTQRETAFAFGAAPVGIQANFRPHKKYQPFAGVGGGFLRFDRPIPNTQGKQFNFTLDFGGGLEIAHREKRSVVLGYKYYHISNADRGTINPGFDNNVFYVGYKFHRW